MKMKNDRNLAEDVRLDPEREQELLEEVDENLALALAGDADAAACIAVSYSAALLEEARAILGPGMSDEAEDVVQDLLADIVAGELDFDVEDESGALLLVNTVRSMAREVRRRRKSAFWWGNRAR